MKTIFFIALLIYLISCQQYTSLEFNIYQDGLCAHPITINYYPISTCFNTLDSNQNQSIYIKKKNYSNIPFMFKKKKKK